MLMYILRFMQWIFQNGSFQNMTFVKDSFYWISYFIAACTFSRWTSNRKFTIIFIPDSPLKVDKPTITGLFSFRGFGIHTLRYRQSSLVCPGGFHI